MIKNIGKITSKNVTVKYNQKPVDHAKESTIDALKTASKTAEVTGDLIGNKIAEKIPKVSKSSPQNSSEK